MIKYFSMFSGIGGFELGIQEAHSDKHASKVEQDGEGWNGDVNESGRDVCVADQSPLCKGRAKSQNKIQKKGCKEIRNTGERYNESTFDMRCDRQSSQVCIGYSEIDKHAISIYKRHFDHKNYGNARNIVPEELPDFDLLVGGFPCQAFSIAGKRGGFDDTRGTLFFEIARIAKVKRPQLLFLENVKGLLSHDNGRTFGTILSTLSDLGYICEWQVLNSKNHGVPQNRERVFIIGHLEGECRRTVFPIGEGNSDFTESREQSRDRLLAVGFDSNYYKGADGKRQMILAPNNRKHKAGDGMATRQRYETDLVPSLQAHAGHTQQSYVKGSKIRRLTPIECERLQGFPDNWTKYGKDGKEISDTQRYKCLGNAVTVNVIRDISVRLFNEEILGS